MANAYSSEQVAQIAYQAGFRGQALVNIVGIVKRESGNTPTAHRTNSDPARMVGDLGLAQINWSNIANLKKKGIISSAQDLLDPLKNLQAAFELSHQGTSWGAWSLGANGWQAGGDWQKGVNLGAASSAVANASAKGMLGGDIGSIPGIGNIVPTSQPIPAPTTPNSIYSPWGPIYGPNGVTGQPSSPNGTFGGGSGQAITSTGPVQPQGKFMPPSDMKIVLGPNMQLWAVYEKSGAKIGFLVNGPNSQVYHDHLDLTTNNVDWVDGGQAEELRGVTENWGSFGSWFDHVLDTVMPKDNPARNDPSVLNALMQYAGRPDMTQAELGNLLHATDWYKNRTQAELNWNGLSVAEQTKQKGEMAAQMAQAWQQYLGTPVAENDPRIQNYIQDLASGKTTLNSWIENTVKPQAALDGQSPYARNLEAEQEARKQQGVDIENTGQRVRDLARKWGVQWSDATLSQWGTDITKKDKSEADLVAALQQQSKILYPWKDPNIETDQAAQPWIETYGRVMEKTGDMFDPKVQAALTAGTPVWQFEQELKKSPDWLTTKNARESMFSLVGQAGRNMGFA